MKRTLAWKLGEIMNLKLNGKSGKRNVQENGNGERLLKESIRIV